MDPEIHYMKGAFHDFWQTAKSKQRNFEFNTYRVNCNTLKVCIWKAPNQHQSKLSDLDSSSNETLVV